MSSTKRERIAAPACVVRGHDIDTDRIIPARFLRCVTFDGLGEHAFTDDREHAKGDHPFDDERFDSAEILVVGHNFGSGSSREHAPQALMRRGYRAFIGASFAEIFAGNCLALGLPCVILKENHLSGLMEVIEADPEHHVVIDLVGRTVTSRAGTVEFEIHHAHHRQLLDGTWDALAALLEAGEGIEATAGQLPYVAGFTGAGAG